MVKVIFLDRDGVINKCAKEHEYITQWENFEFLENVPKAIKLLTDAKYKIVVISNQRGIARGVMTKNEVDELHKRVNEYLNSKDTNIDLFLYCPHEIGECNCRKPGIGLFLAAEKLFNVDKSHSYMIGDSDSDIAAGHNFGVKTIFIGDYNNLADICCKSLYEAVQIILGIGRCV
ncbi:HAD family hydrolase [Clostridium sp. YIM B02515]|uniref:D,D-heptose 1,7-bisphosphate phosphatase n=1 Tax=Clostridium rhizosphaerae TaxID=2803861 RepID=A0ABS1T6C3_9CLOT|nr:HAD family hydrolase [Clostridium rhizosphaerae]MBL4934677.1 HAD family hydrolase [Clostridium rhizosphaerae]